MDFLQILPNLGIGVVAILTLGYIAREFILNLKETHKDHKAQMNELHMSHLSELKERELALRTVEKEVRTNILDQLSRNTHVMERAISVLDRK